MKVAISGSSGLLGRAISKQLGSSGNSVYSLIRRSPHARHEIAWDPVRGIQDLAKMEGIDAVIHLAGENIASGLWTSSKKQRLHASRVLGTHSLVDSFLRMKSPPKVMIAASATGYYGDRGDTELTESSEPGTGFLADLTREWEQELSRCYDDLGMRLVVFRLGVVLSPVGGALEKMLPAFRMGMGGKLGDGTQWMSWISREDVCNLFSSAVFDQNMQGTYNAVAPEPVRNKEFTARLASAVGKSAKFAVPSSILRFSLGQMAEETLLASAKVLPHRLINETEYAFQHRTLDSFLAAELAK